MIRLVQNTDTLSRYTLAAHLPKLGSCYKLLLVARETATWNLLLEDRNSPDSLPVHPQINSALQTALPSIQVHRLLGVSQLSKFPSFQALGPDPKGWWMLAAPFPTHGNLQHQGECSGR